MRDDGIVGITCSNSSTNIFVLCQSELETTRKAEANNRTRQRRIEMFKLSYCVGTISYIKP